MRNMELLNLTPDQIDDAYYSLGVRRFIGLPTNLQQLFSNVPPELPTLMEYLQPITQWLGTHVQTGDYVLIQGDFGMVYHLVNYCKQINVIPIYSAIDRNSSETTQADGSIIIQKRFKHKIFRRYF